MEGEGERERNGNPHAHDPWDVACYLSVLDGFFKLLARRVACEVHLLVRGFAACEFGGRVAVPARARVHAGNPLLQMWEYLFQAGGGSGYI
jgi:hypothetical protein